MTPETAECHRLLEAQDPDRAVSLAFAPDAARDDLAALYAFNIETARVREQVSQPLPGEIRLQWWRDTILSGTAGVGSGHPVAEALGAAILRHDLPRDAFDRFLEARVFDLYDDPMPSRAAFEGYAGDTACALLMLAAMILSRKDAPQVAEAAGHAGVAQAVAGALRLLPIHRRQGHVAFPADLLAASGCDAQDLLQGAAEPSRRAISAMVAFGREHWKQAQALHGAIPASVRGAFLPAALSGTVFDRVERDGVGTIEAPLRVGPLRRSYRYWRWMRG
ncbi:phytoene/squalene synthase family protein [Aurantimonas sp. Leaf443]|uniref:phytoene/squalene synthase family protein n=1 Tax=Aurantimonas sp. Leaf443 TaxID=1736378 RepID=UPI0006FA900A|nr:phytoene/squalene synthase family protein [Aurantimonas sp. Leaf443]KQT82560.1 phytoene synthase [Aurantimonas sp. Leaf443]